MESIKSTYEGAVDAAENTYTEESNAAKAAYEEEYPKRLQLLENVRQLSMKLSVSTTM